MGGVGLALLREQFDTRIFTPEDVRDWVGTHNIAVMPLFLPSNGKQPQIPTTVHAGRRNRNCRGRCLRHRKAPGGVSFLLDRPHSPEAEALRSLHTSVMLSRPGNPPQVLLVVSSLPGEGKTTVAVNLAMAMAQHGTTCLVDADLRRGRVACFPRSFQQSRVDRCFERYRRVGSRSGAYSQCVKSDSSPCACRQREGWTTGVFGPDAQVLDELRRDFQFIVVDSAPILPFADCRALSNLTDGLIFVGRSGITTRELVQRSLELLEQVHAAPVLQFVVNAADIKSPQYRYYQYGYEYYEPVMNEDV